MLRLKVLGGLALTDGEAVRDGIPPKRLAVLAVLAAAGNGGVSRDRILALLWPESDEERARQALSQTLYILRRDLGQDEIVLGTGTLRLNPAHLSTDIGDFDAALAREDFETSAANYAGPFLDGIHINAGAEFDHWADAQRERCAREYVRALTTLARRAESRGEPGVAMGWWQRLIDVDPLNSSAVLALGQLAAASSDRSHALRVLDRHAALLRTEVGLQPGNQLTALRAALMAPIQVSSSPAVTPQQPQAGAPDPGRTPDPAARRAKPANPRRWLVAVALLAVATTIVIALLLRHPPAAGEATVARLQIRTFDVVGADSSDGVGEELAALLREGMSGPGGLQVVRGSDPVSDSAADLVVSGAVVRAGRTLRLSVTMRRARTGELRGNAAAEGPEDSLFSLADNLARQLLADEVKGFTGRLTRSAATNTQSLPAFKAYLEGERDFQAGRFPEAVDAYKHALAADSAFALAWYRLAVAADWAGIDLGFMAGDSASHYRSRLSVRDQALLEGYLAWQHGMIDDAERRYRDLTHAYPDEGEAWYQLAEVQFHLSPLRGRSITAARPTFERVLRFDPGNQEALRHLFRLASMAGDHRELERIYALLTPASRSEQSDLDAFYVLATGDSARIARTVDSMQSASDVGLFNFIWRGMMFTSEYAALERGAGFLAGAEHRVNNQILARLYGSHLAMAQGKRRAAIAWLRGTDRLDEEWGLGLQALTLAAPPVAAPREQLVIIRQGLAQWRMGPVLAKEFQLGDSAVQATMGDDPRMRDYFIGVVSAAMDDGESAEAAANRLDHRPGPVQALAHSCAESIRAQIAFYHGRYDEALRHFQAAEFTTTLGVMNNPLASQAFEHYLRAETLRALGRTDEALDWYASLGQVGPSEIQYLAPAHLRQAEIYQALGRTAEARQHYVRFIELWSNADAEFQPLVQHARITLAALSR